MRPFDSRGISLIETDASNVRNLAVRGAGVSVFAQILAFVVQLGGTMVLARLLMPADFGVVTMVTTFAQLLTSVGWNGLTEAVIQREDIDHYLASNLFWISLAIGVCLTLGFACCGSLLARFYHEPRVSTICAGLAVSIFLYAAPSIHLALLKRAMDFSALAMNNVIARVISVVISIILAAAGWGYWSLVALFVTWPLANCIGALYLCRWVPSYPRRVPGTAAMVRFATNIYSHFILTYAGSNTDNLLVGWRFQAHALGFYKKAYDLFLLPSNFTPIWTVAMSALSKFKHDPVQFKRRFLVALSVLAFLGMAISADLTLVARDAVRLLLGAQWDEAGRIFLFFGPGTGVMLLYGMHGCIHVSIGRADRWLRWGVIELIVMLSLFLICLHWGPVGMASAWSISYWLLFLPAFWYAGRPIHLGIGETLNAVWKYVVSGLLAGAILAGTIPHIGSITSLSGVFGAVSRIVIISVLLGALYTLFVTILHGGLSPIRQLARLMSDILPQNWLLRKSPRVEAVLLDDLTEVSSMTDC